MLYPEIGWLARVLFSAGSGGVLGYWGSIAGGIMPQVTDSVRIRWPHSFFVDFLIRGPRGQGNEGKRGQRAGNGEMGAAWSCQLAGLLLCCVIGNSLCPPFLGKVLIPNRLASCGVL